MVAHKLTYIKEINLKKLVYFVYRRLQKQCMRWSGGSTGATALRKF